VRQRHRFDYNRLATALAERLPAKELQGALARDGDFPRAVLESGGITDWELSQVACEIYGLPFLPVDQAQPAPSLVAELLAAGHGPLLRRSGLVPLAKNGQLLTVAMPALVPAAVLDELARETGLVPAPVVGTVMTNARWLDEFVPEEELAERPADESSDQEPSAPLPGTVWRGKRPTRPN
jgi:hypothetical protein